MKNSNTVAADLVASGGVIDDMEAAALHGSLTPSRKFLAAYQVKLASAPTSRGMDLQFLMYVGTYMNRGGNKT
jgi:hypothetical protein